MGGVAGPKDEIGQGERRRDIERLFHATQDGRLPGEFDAMERDRNTSSDRLGESERLIFVAGLAIADEPDDEGGNH